MLPTIKPGQLAIVCKKIPKNPLNRLIIFENQGILKIKRVIRIKGSDFWVLGDNREFSQDSRHFGLVKKEDIKGSVIRII